MADPTMLSSSTVNPAPVNASGAGGSVFNGGSLPMVTSTGTAQQSVPDYYSNYLNSLATQGQAGGASAQFAGASPLQQQAFQSAAGASGAYIPSMNAASNNLNQVSNYNPTTAGAGALNSALGQNAMGAANPYLNSAANPTYNTVGNYMNPYVNSVVSQIGDLSQQNIMNNVAPQTTAGIVGSGQFGSSRGASALANTLGQYNQQTTAQQLGALNTGYNNAMTQAQNQANLFGQLGQTAGNITNQQQSNLTNIGQVQGNQASQEQQNLINTAQAQGNIAAQTSALGWNDINNTANLGGQQQQIAQAGQMFPLTVAQQQANIMRGFTIPTATATTQTAPAQTGQLQNSPLTNIAGLGALLASPNYSKLFDSFSSSPGYDNTASGSLSTSNPYGAMDAVSTAPSQYVNPADYSAGATLSPESALQSTYDFGGG